MSETGTAGESVDGTAGPGGEASSGSSGTGAAGSSGTTTGEVESASTSGVSTGGAGSTGGANEETGFERGIACPDNYAPVCGKDGHTYGNACEAGVAGVEVRREGPCLGDCEGSCVVEPRGLDLVGLLLVVLAVIRPRRARRPR